MFYVFDVHTKVELYVFKSKISKKDIAMVTVFFITFMQVKTC